jgi:hypothetical protein
MHKFIPICSAKSCICAHGFDPSHCYILIFLWRKVPGQTYVILERPLTLRYGINLGWCCEISWKTKFSDFNAFYVLFSYLCWLSSLPELSCYILCCGINLTCLCKIYFFPFVLRWHRHQSLLISCKIMSDNITSHVSSSVLHTCINKFMSWLFISCVYDFPDGIFDFNFTYGILDEETIQIYF